MGLVVLLLLLAIVAAIFGFGGIATGLTSIALVLFWIFLALLVLGFVIRMVRGSWWWY